MPNEIQRCIWLRRANEPAPNANRLPGYASSLIHLTHRVQTATAVVLLFVVTSLLCQRSSVGLSLWAFSLSLSRVSSFAFTCGPNYRRTNNMAVPTGSCREPSCDTELQATGIYAFAVACTTTCSHSHSLTYPLVALFSCHCTLTDPPYLLWKTFGKCPY